MTLHDALHGCDLPVDLSQLHFCPGRYKKKGRCDLPVDLSQLHFTRSASVMTLHDALHGCDLPVDLSQLHYQQRNMLT